MAKNLNEGVARTLISQQWYQLCVRYRHAPPDEQLEILEDLGVDERMHFKAAWVALYGPAAPPYPDLQ